jgi:hypothetical protein
MYLGTVYVCCYQISARSDFKYGCQVAILENQLRTIDMQLYTYVPLGNSNSQTKFWSSLILSLATRGLKQKTQKVLQLLN